ncbi:MAG: ABC transporter substrate-binding protein [Rhodospirillales bacterium]|nr:ABC transporter substrate-binding protein [Rhodospirillales bacterium]
MKTISFAVAGALVLSTAVAGTGMAQEPIRLGVATAVSGDAAAYGKPLLDAIQYMTGEFNKTGGIMGRPLQVVYYDDRGVPDQGLQAAKKLVFDDKVHVLQPGSTSGVILTAMPVGKDGKVAMWGYGLAKQWLVEGEGAIFRAGVPEQVSVTAMATFAHSQRKLRRIGILHIDSFPGESTRDLFKSAFERGGNDAKIVAIAATPEGNRDFSSQLLTLSRAKPDGVVIAVYGSGFAPAFRQARQFLGKDVVLMETASQMSDPKTRAEIQELAGGAYYASSPMTPLSPNPMTQQMVGDLTKRFGIYQEFMGRAVVGMMVTKEAIERAKSTDAMAIMKEVHKMRDFATPAGPFTYDPRDGEALKTGVVIEGNPSADPSKDKVVFTARTNEPIYKERVDYTRIFGAGYREQLYKLHQVD